MPYFDRFDIAEAYAVYSWHWHIGGLTQRDRAKGRVDWLALADEVNRKAAETD